MTGELSAIRMTSIAMADNVVKLSSPVKSPLAIVVIPLESRYLRATAVSSARVE